MLTGNQKAGTVSVVEDEALTAVHDVGVVEPLVVTLIGRSVEGTRGCRRGVRSR